MEKEVKKDKEVLANKEIKITLTRYVDGSSKLDIVQDIESCIETIGILELAKYSLFVKAE